jgi:hypothetical protein
MKPLKLIKANGETEELTGDMPLERAQKLVGGYIEVVHLGNGYKVGAKALLVNEEGLIHKLPYNMEASEIALKALVGDCVLFEWEKGDFEDGE